MKEFAIRLTKGADLKQSIESICKENHLNTAVVLSAVGCVDKINIRLAGAKECLEVEEEAEIVSLMGTISLGKAHLHVSFSDELGNVFGGHLKEGCIINTTSELVLGVLDEYESKRVFDEKTGYDEIVFSRR